MKRNDVPKHVAALAEAVEIAGGQSAFAQAIREYFVRNPARDNAGRGRRVTQQAVSYWLKNWTLLDPLWWSAIEEVTSDRVARARLRPDVFPRRRAAA